MKCFSLVLLLVLLLLLLTLSAISRTHSVLAHSHSHTGTNGHSHGGASTGTTTTTKSATATNAETSKKTKKKIDNHSHHSHGEADSNHAHSHHHHIETKTKVAGNNDPTTGDDQDDVVSVHSHSHSKPASKHGDKPMHSHSHSSSQQQSTGSSSTLAYDSLVATAAITLLGNAGIAIFYFSNVSELVLRLLSAFAVGGLLGDAFLHLIPHALGGGHVDHEHAHTEGLWILLGIGSFFVIEKMTEALHPDRSSHSHSHSLEIKELVSRADDDDGDGSTTSSTKKKSKKNTTPNDKEKKNRSRTKSPSPRAARVSSSSSSSSSSRSAGTQSTTTTTIKPGAVLNLIADATHNFLDGMALVSAFRVSRSLGAQVTLAVILHEIPHEMGDFAVLVSNGFSPRSALLAQFVSAVGALLGCLLALALSDAHRPSNVLLLTAGGFIYVALVDVVPDLLERKRGENLVHILLQFACMGLGIYLMYAVGELEEETGSGGTLAELAERILAHVM